MGEGGELMSQGEALRWALVERLRTGQAKQRDVAEQLGLSIRQVKRLCRRVREQGAAGLISQRRGRPSNRLVPQWQREPFLALLRQRYAGFGPQLAHEHLVGEHGFGWSVETLRQWMAQAGLWETKPRQQRRGHPPRQRRARLGELVQIDASHHDWFEERGQRCCLIAFIDDATGRVLGARFMPSETTEGYFAVLHEVIDRHGAPLALYSDRHAIFTKADPDDARPTQFERALWQLGIEPICAHSPQAKGRVERLFQTLQDRMVKSMRLADIEDLDAANRWLPSYVREHNQRFAVAPREPQDMHRPWQGTARGLEEICALHHQRQVSAQGACRFEGCILQLEPRQAAAPKARAMIDIAQLADGTLRLSYCGRPLRHRSYACNGHHAAQKRVTAKTLDGAVDAVVLRERARLSRLKNELAFQEVQRARGVFHPDTPPIVPSRARTVGPALRPAPTARAP